MVFTALPLITAVVFVSSVLSASSHFERLFSLLGLVSLLTTAYIMRSSPLQPDRKGKKPMTVRNERMARLHAGLVPGTSAICLLLALVYLSAGSSWGIRPVLYLMPGGMFPCLLLPEQRLIVYYSHACDDSSRTKGDALCRPHPPQRSTVRIQRSLARYTRQCEKVECLISCVHY
jgi:hypothetical protein